MPTTGMLPLAARDFGRGERFPHPGRILQPEGCLGTHDPDVEVLRRARCLPNALERLVEPTLGKWDQCADARIGAEVVRLGDACAEPLELREPPLRVVEVPAIDRDPGVHPCAFDGGGRVDRLHRVELGDRVPVFVGVFEQFDGELPTITKFTVALSNSLKGYWWGWILGIAGSVWGFRKWKSTHRGRGQWDAFRLRIPMKIGDIVQKVALARWSRTLSALVSAGVPLLAALDITAKTAGNRVVENAMEQVIESVSRGGTIAEPLKAARSSRAWSATWSASARRPARWTPC